MDDLYGIMILDVILLLFSFSRKSSNRYSLVPITHLGSGSWPWIPSHGTGLKSHQKMGSYSHSFSAISCRPVITIVHRVHS